MKIRTDFVTNSSSSSFILGIRFGLVDGKKITFEAEGGTDESGLVNYFNYEAIVNVSPKQLGQAKDIDELIKLLADGVTDGDYDDEEYDEEEDFAYIKNIFSESCPKKNDYGETFDAYDFIKEIRENISDMEQIETITINGDEYNYEEYCRTYTYNLKTKKYTGYESGEEFEKNGSSGGGLYFTDLDSCDITYDSEEWDEEE